MFKKILVLVTVLTLPLTALAVGIDTSGGEILSNVAGGSGYGRVDENSLTLSVANLLRAFFSLLGIVFLIVIIYGGIQWMTASGNEEQVTKAKGLIMNATIGLAIVILAFSITYFVSYILGSSTYTDNPWYYN